MMRRLCLRLVCLLTAALLTGCAGTNQIKDEKNPDCLKRNSRGLLHAAESFAPSVVLTETTPAEVSDIFSDLIRCRADLFWLSPDYHYEAQGKTVRVFFSYRMEQAQAEHTAQQLKQRADEIISSVSASLPVVERTRLLHDRLIASVCYETGGSDMPLFDALMTGRANCEGYARALQYLLMRAGISAYYVTGDADGPHAWLMVQDENGTWAHVDPTFDDIVCTDGTSFGSYAYFWLNDRDISRTHTLSDTGIPYPAADTESYPGMVHAGDPDTFAQTARTALTQSSAHGNGAAEILFSKGVNENTLSLLDQAVMQAAESFGVTVARRVTSKNSRIISYAIKTVQ